MPKIITKPIVGITGSRSIKTLNLSRYIRPTSPAAIYHGGASGVDTIAANWADAHKIECVEFLPVPRIWDNNYKLACLKRNEDIVNACDVLIAFWDGESKGTLYTIEYAIKVGRPYILHMVYDLD